MVRARAINHDGARAQTCGRCEGEAASVWEGTPCCVQPKEYISVLAILWCYD